VSIGDDPIGGKSIHVLLSETRSRNGRTVYAYTVREKKRTKKKNNETYSGDVLHDDDERVAGEISRVTERVLLPDLTKDSLVSGQGLVVDTEVTLEEGMNESTHDEPEECGLTAKALEGGMALLVGESQGTDGDGAKSGEEDG